MEGFGQMWMFSDEDEELFTGSLLEELVGEMVHYMVEMGFAPVDISRSELGVHLRFQALEERARELFQPIEVSEIALTLGEGEGAIDVNVEMRVSTSSVRRPTFYVKVDRGLSNAGVLEKPLEGEEELLGVKVQGNDMVLMFRKRYSLEHLFDRLSEVIDEERYVSAGELIFKDLKVLLWRFAALAAMEE